MLKKIYNLILMDNPYELDINIKLIDYTRKKKLLHSPIQNCCQEYNKKIKVEKYIITNKNKKMKVS